MTQWSSDKVYIFSNEKFLNREHDCDLSVISKEVAFWLDGSEVRLDKMDWGLEPRPMVAHIDESIIVRFIPKIEDCIISEKR